jgi:hypothetical protein
LIISVICVGSWIKEGFKMKCFKAFILFFQELEQIEEYYKQETKDLVSILSDIFYRILWSIVRMRV